MDTNTLTLIVAAGTLVVAAVRAFRQDARDLQDAAARNVEASQMAVGMTVDAFQREIAERDRRDAIKDARIRQLEALVIELGGVVPPERRDDALGEVTTGE